jgi:GTP-dependent phosphoenolpyruvate carboxykinase
LLDHHNIKFDRDFLDFHARIAELEAALQAFINQSFENITSIDTQAWQQEFLLHDELFEMLSQGLPKDLLRIRTELESRLALQDAGH